jgi:hypothetical protein
MINKLDDAVLKALDATVAWLWDTFGIRYASQLLFGTALLLLAAAGIYSDGGQHYRAVFWVMWPISTLVYGGACIQAIQTPSEVRNAMKAALRKGVWFVLCRWAMPGVMLVVDIPMLIVKPGADSIASVVFWVVWGVWNLWTDAIQPTRPRKKRRVTLRFLTPLLQPISSAR